MFSLYIASIALFIVATFGYSSDSSKPNIIILLADDLGWNDVGYHGASNIETPNIDKLANLGLRLESHYVLPLCSPTRAALLTGRYPIHLGISSSVFKGSDTYGLSLSQPTLAETLSNTFGYSTHMIGKWHLGYAAWQYTPTYRGFDTFFGFYLGEQSKFTHIHTLTSGSISYEGYDLRNGIERADMDKYNGYYSAWLEGNKTIELLNELSPNNGNNDPFFMYLAFSTPHKPVEAPDYTIEKYNDVVDSETRQEYSAMVDILDDVIGNVVNNVKQLGMWENTLIIFMSDNGGETQHGDNFPLCGNKNMLFEGGVRSPTFIIGGYLSNTMNGKLIKNELIHVTDWYPTIISILSDNYITKQNNKITTLSENNNDNYIGNIDGINQWPFINGENNDKSLRNEILYNIDPNLCVQTTTTATSDSENSESDSENNSDSTEEETKNICGAIRVGKYKYIIANRNDKTSWNSLWQSGIPSVNCGDAAHYIKKTEISATRCRTNTGCLFDIESDPCELSDLSNNEEYTDIINELHNKLSIYYDQVNDPLEVVYSSDTDSANPNNNDGFWEPWLDLTEETNPYKKLKLPKLNGVSNVNSINVNVNSKKLDVLDVSSEVNKGEERISKSWNTMNGKYLIILACLFSFCSFCVCLSICKNWCEKRKEDKENKAKFADTEFSPLLNQI